MEQDTKRIQRMKKLGEELDRVRVRAEDLCSQIAAEVADAAHSSANEDPAQPPPHKAPRRLR